MNQYLYSGLTFQITKVFNRIDSPGTGPAARRSASITSAYYNTGGGIFPLGNAPPQLVENLSSVSSVPDHDGTHFGQVLQIPVPDNLGIFTINPSTEIFGEFFST